MCQAFSSVDSLSKAAFMKQDWPLHANLEPLKRAVYVRSLACHNRLDCPRFSEGCQVKALIEESTGYRFPSVPGEERIKHF